MLSQTSEYAMRAMSCLAINPEESRTAAGLARATSVPPDYLAKVLQQLASAGLITGRRGVGGGYQLARAPDQIRLIDVVSAVAEVKRIETCPLGLPMHGTNLCPLHRTTDAAIKAVIDVYANKTLADMLNNPGANTPLCEAQLVGAITLSAKGNGAPPAVPAAAPAPAPPPAAAEPAKAPAKPRPALRPGSARPKG